MSQALTVAPPGKSAAPLRSAGRPSYGVPSDQQRVRTPLSVVPVRQVRHRAPLAVFGLLVLVAALAAVLMINISVSSTQYDLVQLRGQQTALNQENEALVLEIEGREAPQNLAAAATKLKMVSFPTFGTIDLDSKKVTGDPEPATDGPKPDVLIAAPNLTPKQPAPLAAPENAAPGNVAEEPAPDGGADATGQSVTEDGAAAAADAAGTIPGPVQSSGNP